MPKSPNGMDRGSDRIDQECLFKTTRVPAQSEGSRQYRIDGGRSVGWVVCVAGASRRKQKPNERGGAGQGRK